ncbi:uncharacterized protein [Prorops nasuta]
MTEGGPPRMKRNAARLFKNPPQPHMCIQDFIQGSTPCYINVLSWGKVSIVSRPPKIIPLYGGMRLPSPRNMHEALIFAVMVNPEVLRFSGKNAEDPMERSGLIEAVLDFVEAMNAGVIFTRHYTILKDRDITGELKEIWNAVQALRDRENALPQQETWIDAQPPVPQYPQYQEQVQQQEYTSQPPQYHTSLSYGRPVNMEPSMHYDNYNQVQVPITQSDQMYQSGQMMQQQYPGNLCMYSQDRFNFRDRSREHIIQNIPQQNCPAYTSRPYSCDSRQMIPQYMNTMHPILNPPCSGINTNQPTAFAGVPTSHMRMSLNLPLQMQQPAMPFDAIASLNNQPNCWGGAVRGVKSHVNIAQKNYACYNTHNKQISQNSNNGSVKDMENNGKPKSPVKVLQREAQADQVESSITPTDNGKVSVEQPKATSDQEQAKPAQTTDSKRMGKNYKANPEKIQVKTTQKTLIFKSPVLLDAQDDDIYDLNRDFSFGLNLTFPKSKSKKSHKSLKDKANNSDNIPNKTSVNHKATEAEKIEVKKTIESPKRSQTTVNSIIKSVFKLQPGMAGEEGSLGKKKSNGQTRYNTKNVCENNEIQQQGITILKKTEPLSQETVIHEMTTQLSIQDCKDTNEVSAVLS